MFASLCCCCGCEKETSAYLDDIDIRDMSIFTKSEGRGRERGREREREIIIYKCKNYADLTSSYPPLFLPLPFLLFYFRISFPNDEVLHV